MQKNTRLKSKIFAATMMVVGLAAVGSIHRAAAVQQVPGTVPQNEPLQPLPDFIKPNISQNIDRQASNQEENLVSNNTPDTNNSANANQATPNQSLPAAIAAVAGNPLFWPIVILGAIIILGAIGWIIMRRSNKAS